MGAPAVSAASLRQSPASPQPPLVIDVRKNERFRESADLIRGALRRDPERIAEWTKIDRIACPWRIRRFVGPQAEFLYVPAPDVRRVAQEREAVPYDISDVAFSHEGERCSFDAFLAAYRLRDPALDAIARIVRGADTSRLELAPQAADLAAIPLGLSRIFGDDHVMVEHGVVMYDALYRWCKKGKSELRTWNPEAYR